MSGEFKHYDEQFTLAGAPYQFMLARPGTPSNVSSSPFAPKSVFGDRTYADYDAISAVALTDFAGGMGQERQADATMYYDALDIDARGGQLALGPLRTFVSSASGGISFDNGWAEIGSGAYTRRARRILTAANETHLERVWLPLKADKGVGAVTVKLYDNFNGVPGTVLATATISAANLTAYGQWLEAKFTTPQTLTGNVVYWISVEQTSATPVYIRQGININNPDSYYWDGSLSLWLNDGTNQYGLLYNNPKIAPDSPPRLFTGAGADQIARVWAWAGRALYYMGTTGAPTPVTTTSGGAVNLTAADITGHAWFDGPADTAPWLYLALGDSTDLTRFNASIGAEAWETLTGHKARCLTNHDNLLVYAYDRNKLDCYNGTSWGASSASYVEVGDRTYPVRALVSWNGAVWAGKDDGLYKVTIPAGYPVTGSLACQKIIDFGVLAGPENFGFLIVHQGDLYFPINNGIMRFTVGNVLQSIGFDTALNVSADKRYHHRAAVSVLSSLWLLSESGLRGDGKLMAYSDGHWHPLANHNDSPLRSICVEPGWYGNLPRLWVAHNLRVAYYNMPTTTQRRWLWSDADYAASGEFYTSWIDGNIRTVEKDWLSVEVDARNVDPNTLAQVTVYWRPDEDDPWELVGWVESSDITTLAFPAGSHSGKCQLKITLGRSETLGTPRVQAIVLKYLERPEDIRSHTRAYKLADRLENRNGALVTRSLAEQLADLRTLREAKEPLTWRAWYGTEYQAHIVDFSVSEMPDEERGPADKGAMLAIVRLQEIG